MRKVLAVVVILASVFSIATRPPDNNIIAGIEYPVVAAHRGGAGVWPENTLAGFKATAAAHPGMPLEMDVQAISDGTLVVFHDTKIDRVAVTGTGLVSAMTKTQWKSLRIKSPTGGASAPATTLDQVVAEFKGKNTPLVIEIKDMSVADKFIETVWPIRSQVITQSFDTTVASRLARSGFSTLQLSTQLPATIVPGVEHVGISNVNLTQAFVNTAHNQGVRVWAWGNDVTATMPNPYGIDGFITDNPGG